jgi:hypothetical protein
MELLTQEQAEILITSFIQSRLEKGLSFTEQECKEVTDWATRTLVDFATFSALMDGKMDIEDFSSERGITFKSSDMGIEEYVNRLFEKNGE